MNISYTKIDPAGNITVVVDSFVPREQQSRVASELMKRDVTVEQVGFLEKPDDPCCAVRLQMMGGEFCGNASLSAAALSSAAQAWARVYTARSFSRYPVLRSL